MTSLPQGALAVTVSKGDSQVQHILLTAESLEKETLFKLLAKYTDCVYFYPSKEEKKRKKRRKKRRKKGNVKIFLFF